jgi:hypothetical protein
MSDEAAPASSSGAAGAGNGPAAKKRRMMEGMSVAGSSNKYLAVAPRPKLYHRVFKTPNTNISSEAMTIQFQVQAADTEIIRFTDDPFILLFNIKRRNPDYRAGGLQPKYIFVMPQELEPAIYINPLLGGRTFFSNIEVVLDGTRIELPLLSDQGMHFQVLNRLFCTDGVRKDKYGDFLYWISTDEERTHSAAVPAEEGFPELPILFKVPPRVSPSRPVKGETPDQEKARLDRDERLRRPIPYEPPPFKAYVPAKPLYRHPQLIKVMNSLAFEAKEDSNPAMIMVGFDCIPPISMQCNALRMITKQKIENSYLHPGIKVDFTLTKTKELDACIERASVSDDEYFDENGVIPDPEELKVEFVGMFLAYESCILEDQLIAELKKATNRYYIDWPHMRTNDLAHGVMYDEQRLILPAGTKVVYLCFLYEPQIVLKAKRNSYLSTRYTFPPFLQELHLKLVGKEGLIFKEGFQGLTMEARKSVSLKLYHADLVRKGLYSRHFDYFCPRQTSGFGYDQAIVMDLSHYKLEDTSELTVVLKYKDTTARPRWFLRTYPVTQGMLEYSEKSKWSSKENV